MGGLYYKFVSPGQDGVPDRIIQIDGMTWFVELKTKAGHLSQVQEMQIRRLRSRGARVRVLYGREGVNRFLKELEKCMERTV